MQHRIFLEQASLPFLISFLKSRLRQVSWPFLAPHGLTPEQYVALRALLDGPGQCHGRLACTLGLDKPSTTRLVQGLARKGLVRVLPDPAHARKRRLELTEAGHEAMEGLEGFRQQMREGLERGFSEEERSQVRALLRRLIGNLEVMEDAAAGLRPAGGCQEGTHVDR